ncbi:hypothetical protein ACWCQN_13060 [Streptomyces sp. NPDC001984]
MTAKATKKRAPAAAHGEAEFRRWTPEEVVELRLLPYRSVRVLRERCYRREVFHHRDGGRITFTADDLRRQNERTAVEPLTA